MAAKEIWVYFLAHNLIRIIMAQAATLYELIPRQLSFKHCRQLWQACRQCSFDINDSIGLLSLLQIIGENIVGNRPGRIEPRTVKRRPKPYPRMKRKRNKEREILRKYRAPQEAENDDGGVKCIASSITYA